MPEATTLTDTEQQKQTDKPEHHQTQAATGSPQAGGSSTAGSPVGSTGSAGPSVSGGAPIGSQMGVSSGGDISSGAARPRCPAGA